MRQVPHYLIIGNGRVARHFLHYFNLLNIQCDNWHRQESFALLSEKINQATHILILISDSEIEKFAEMHLRHTDAMLIHFSGSLVSEKIFGAHPLMCFNPTLYSDDQYPKIPFIIDHDAPDFESLLPGLPNQHVRLNKEQKAKYHALCVMSGNFSCILWQKLFSGLEKEFQIPAEIAHGYLMQQTNNLIQNPKTALTGPLVRNDKNTLEKNISALANDPFQTIYKSFVTCYEQLQKVSS